MRSKGYYVYLDQPNDFEGEWKAGLIEPSETHRRLYPVTFRYIREYRGEEPTGRVATIAWLTDDAGYVYWVWALSNPTPVWTDRGGLSQDVFRKTRGRQITLGRLLDSFLLAKTSHGGTLHSAPYVYDTILKELAENTEISVPIRLRKMAAAEVEYRKPIEFDEFDEGDLIRDSVQYMREQIDLGTRLTALENSVRELLSEVRNPRGAATPPPLRARERTGSFGKVPF